MAKEIPLGWCSSLLLFNEFTPSVNNVPHEMMFRNGGSLGSILLTTFARPIYPTYSVAQIQTEINSKIINPANTIINVISFDLDGLLICVARPSADIINPAYGKIQPFIG